MLHSSPPFSGVEVDSSGVECEYFFGDGQSQSQSWCMLVHDILSMKETLKHGCQLISPNADSTIRDLNETETYFKIRVHKNADVSFFFAEIHGVLQDCIQSFAYSFWVAHYKQLRIRVTRVPS